MIFPTNKEHISYSEVKNWRECPWKHKLMYIDKIETYENNPYAEFGTIVHDTIESYLKTGTMTTDQVEPTLKEKWEEHGFDTAEYIAKMVEQRAKFAGKPKQASIAKKGKTTLKKQKEKKVKK